MPIWHSTHSLVLLGHIETRWVARVNISGADERLYECLAHDWCGLLCWLPHGRAHLGEQPEEERQEGAHASILEGDTPRDVSREADGRLECGTDARHVIGKEDGLVEALVLHGGEGQIECRALAHAAPAARLCGHVRMRNWISDWGAREAQCT